MNQLLSALFLLLLCNPDGAFECLVSNDPLLFDSPIDDIRQFRYEEPWYVLIEDIVTYRLLKLIVQICSFKSLDHVLFNLIPIFCIFVYDDVSLGRPLKNILEELEVDGPHTVVIFVIEILS